MIDNDSHDGSEGDGGRHVLTGLPESIQLSATNESPEPLSEHDQAAVNAFLDTLARIALAVAGRRPSSRADEVERLKP